MFWHGKFLKMEEATKIFLRKLSQKQPDSEDGTRLKLENGGGNKNILKKTLTKITRF
jgi:hypothetical protein